MLAVHLQMQLIHCQRPQYWTVAKTLKNKYQLFITEFLIDEVPIAGRDKL